MSLKLNSLDINPFCQLEKLDKEFSPLLKNKTHKPKHEDVKKIFSCVTEIFKNYRLQLVQDVAKDPSCGKFLRQMGGKLGRLDRELFKQKREGLQDKTIQGAIGAIQHEARLMYSKSKKDELDIKHSISKKYSLVQLRDILGNLTAKYMTELAKLHLESLEKYKTDNKYLRKGMWYSDQFYKACVEKKQNKTIELISSPTNFKNGWAPAKYFSRVKDAGSVDGIAACHFHVKKDVLPSVAIKALFEELVIGDCGMACNIARYRTLLDVLGEEKFNRIFSYCRPCEPEDDILPMTTGFVYNTNQPMTFLTSHVEQAEGTKSNRPIKIGQLVYFEGAPNYKYKKPFGSNRGMNTICTNDIPGKQTFAGLGLEKGSKEEDIEEELIETYNTNECPFSGVPDDIKNTYIKKFPDNIIFCKAYESDKIDKVKGYNFKRVIDFNVSLIKKLIDTPLKDISFGSIIKHPSNAKLYQNYTDAFGKDFKIENARRKNLS